MESLMISNWPVRTVTRKRVMAQKMIQVTGKRLKATPLAAALRAVTGGIWYAPTARRKVTQRPARPAIHAGLRRTPRSRRRVKMGTAASRAEKTNP